MKLPDNKKEQIQLIALIIISIIFVVYVAGSLAIKPMMKKRADRLKRIEELKSKIDMAEGLSSMLAKGKKINTDTINQILRTSETNNYIMKSRLGNYLIGATELIDKAAKQEHIIIDDVSNGGISEIPSPRKKEKFPFKFYTAKVTMTGGIHNLLRMIHNLENSNPYLSISRIDITGQEKDAEQHLITFYVQWPIWQDDNMLENLKKSRMNL